ncbi:MAG: 2-dehydropantoate 2-reductase [Gammaproteobacteria bacterium]|jgi:2-dehydropantoate 2-reductase
MGKRVVFVGGGAVGGHVGGHLARAGEDVTIIDMWPEHVDKMKANGLTLSGTTEPECFTVPVRALHLTEVQGLAKEAPFDIAFVCVKSYDTAWATTLIAPYLSPNGFVVSLQNCLNEETIAQIVGWGKTTGCVASVIAVELTAPGQVRRNVPLGGENHTVFRVGEPHGRLTERVQAVATMLSVVDSAKATNNLWGERWSKLVANSMYNGLSAATGLTGKEGDRDAHHRSVAIRLAGEAVLVGQALGYQLESIYGLDPATLAAAAQGNNAAMDELDRTLVERSQTPGGGNHRPSMGQDMVKGRRTEIEYLNGFVHAKGREVGIDTPANAAMTAVVQRVERGETAPALGTISGV